MAGTEIATLRMIQALSSPAFHHVALCAKSPSQTSHFLAAAGVPSFSYSIPDLSFRRPAPFLAASFRLSRLLRQAGTDVVHCSDVTAGFDATVAARLARLPVICHIRNPQREIQGRYKLLLRGVSRYIFVSRHAWEQFAVDVGPDRASVIYDGIDIAPIDHAEARAALGAEFGIPRGARVVGMVARLADQKDYPTLIKAAARVVPKYPDIRFVVVGDHSTTAAYREYYRRLTELVRAHRLMEHFVFTGFRTETAKILAGLDIFVLATHFEGFGLAIVEAMAQGRPTIATSVGGVTEIVQDGENGLLHRHEDDDDLAEKILTLLTDHQLASRVGRAGLMSVRARFETTAFAEHLAVLYRSLLK